MIPIWVETWLKDSVVHFLLSALLGFLGFWLTLTILYVLVRFLGLVISSKFYSQDVTIFMFIISILVGVLLALWAHSALDALLDWYRTPLGPPLDLGG